MPVNRYYNPRVYEESLYAPPVDFIAKALDSAQKQYDVNLDLAEKLRNQYVQARPQDRARANEIQGDISKRVDDIAAKYAGDYSGATKDLYRLRSDIGKMFGPGGEAAAIQGNYLIEQQSLKDEKDRLAKGEINQEQYQALQDYYKKAPSTTKAADNTYSVLNPIALAKYVDHSKIYKETLDKTKPRTVSYDRYAGKGPGGNIIYETIKQSSIDPTELYNKFSTDLENDDGFRNYINQTAQLQGRDPSELMQNLLSDYATNVIPRDSGLFENTRSTKLYDDFDYRERVKYNYQTRLKAQELSNSKALARYKKDLTDQSELPIGESVLAPIKGTGSSFRPVSDTIDVPVGIPNGLYQPTIKVPRSVDKYIGKGQDSEVNVPLLASLKTANPKMRDSDIWRLYNDAVKNNQDQAMLTMTQFQTTSAQQEEANRLLPSLITGRRDIYKVDGKTGEISQVTKVEDRRKLAKMWAVDDNPMKAKFGALGKTRVNSGSGVPFGTVMPDPDGGSSYYVVKENRADFDNLQRYVLDPAFNFIHQDLRRQGDPFDLYVDGKPMKVMGRKEYSNGHMYVVYYPAYVAGRNGKYQPDLEDPLTIRGQFVTPSMMEDMLINREDLLSTFPHKTKAAGENEVNNIE